MKTFNLLFIVTIVLSLSSCSFRLVDFTAISSKNVSLDIDRTQGKKVKGEQKYFLGIGWNLKDAMDKALESAGPEYDLLIDGVVRYGSLFFFTTVTVEGTAVSSKAMQKKHGDARFKDWLNGQKLTYNKRTKIINSETASPQITECLEISSLNPSDNSNPN